MMLVFFNGRIMNKNELLCFMIKCDDEFPDFQSIEVAEKYKTYPEHLISKILIIRRLIFDISKQYSEIGSFEEILKWNEPSYTPLSKSGTTLRIDWKKNNPNFIGLFVNCKTSLIDIIRRSIDDDTLIYKGKRAIYFPIDTDLPIETISKIIFIVFTYYNKESNFERAK